MSLYLLHFADEAPKPDKTGDSPVVLHKPGAKVGSQFPGPGLHLPQTLHGLSTHPTLRWPQLQEGEVGVTQP